MRQRFSEVRTGMLPFDVKFCEIGSYEICRQEKVRIRENKIQLLFDVFSDSTSLDVSRIFIAQIFCIIEVMRELKTEQ